MSAAKVDWNEENVERLRKGIESGQSFSQIARTIPGCTRVAASGKAWRLGISQPPPASKPARSVHAQSAKRAPAFKIARRGTVFQGAESRPPRVVIPFTDEPAGTRTILTLGFGECRFPIGDGLADDLTFCGCAVSRGSWCADHAKRVFTSEATRKWVDRKLAMPAKTRWA